MNNILHPYTPEDKITHDARALSSGTLSYLIKRTDYRSIDLVQAAFIEFCLKRAGAFENWAQAWVKFDEAFNYASLDLSPQYEIVHTPDGPQYTFAPAGQQLSMGF